MDVFLSWHIKKIELRTFETSVAGISFDGAIVTLHDRYNRATSSIVVTAEDAKMFRVGDPMKVRLAQVESPGHSVSSS